MKAKDQNNSSQKNLKSKYLQKSNRPKRIMLTDLCPQQKAKIGQLIKTLQIRKKQNSQLQQIVGQKEERIHILQQRMKYLQEQVKKKQGQCISIKNQMLNEEKHKIQRDIEVEQLKLQIERLSKKQKIFINMSSNTENINLSNCQTQTQFKKKKTKNKELQVQIIKSNEDQYQNRQFYRPNTKSFQKIMNNSKHTHNSNYKHSQNSNYKHSQNPNFKNSQNPNFKHNQNKKNKDSNEYSSFQASKSQHTNAKDLNTYFQFEDQKQNYKKLTVQQLQNVNKWEQIQNDDQNMQIQDTDEDDQFQLLARKWLQLKQKNIHQIKQNGYSPVGIDDYRNNYKKISVQQFNIKHQQDQIEIDQIQLNKALKDKDFSASRILNNSHGSTSRQNNRKSSNSINKRQYAITKQKREFFNKKNQQSDLKVIKKQIDSNLIKSSKNVDFYESDIMDIVESLNS